MQETCYEAKFGGDNAGTLTLDGTVLTFDNDIRGEWKLDTAHPDMMVCEINGKLDVQAMGGDGRRVFLVGDANAWLQAIADANGIGIGQANGGFAAVFHRE